MLTNKDLHKDILELEKVRSNKDATVEEIAKAQLKAEILNLKHNPHNELIRDLQIIHDGDIIDLWKTELQKVAKRYKLEWKFN